MPSSKASINITLKRDVTTTGTAAVGGGMTPLLWDASITPMMFMRRFQLAGSYQANNTGRDASGQLNVLTIEDMRHKLDNNLMRPAMLGIELISPSGFAENRHLNNNIHLINANTLQKLNKDLQLRTSVSFIYDQQQQSGDTRRIIFTPSDTITALQKMSNTLINRLLIGEISLLRNRQGSYMKNKLEFQTHWDVNNGNVDDGKGQAVVVQKHNNPFYTISNRLDVIKPYGKKLVRVNSFLFYDLAPQNLVVTPGQFPKTLHEGISYDQVRQDVHLQRMVSNHSVSINHVWRRWNYTPALGVHIQHFTRKSEIFVGLEGRPSEGLFKSETSGYQMKSFLKNDFLYKWKNKLKVSISLPLMQHNVILEDETNPDNIKKINKMVLDPDFNVDYNFNAFLNLNGSYTFNHIFGSPSAIHYNWLLKDHRTLHIHNAPLEEGRGHNFRTFLSYRNPIISYFFSGIYNYSIRENYLMYTNKVQDDGSTMFSTIGRNNSSYNHMVNLRMSKHIEKLSGILSFNGTFMQNKSQQLVNERIFNAIYNSFTFSPKADIKFTPWMNGVFSSEWMSMAVYQEQSRMNQFETKKYFATLVFFPRRNQSISFQGEFYQHKKREDFFLDLFYRYTISKHKIDIDLKCHNLLNHNMYRDYFVSSFVVVENQYLLRPAQLLLAVNFNF
jgi:hypothetical protein